MSKFEAGNGAVTVTSGGSYTPRCVDVSTHLCGRDVETNAKFWASRDKGDGREARDAYVTVSLKGFERDFEIPKSDKDNFTPATDQNIFFDVEDARALRDALTAALDCADIK